MVGASRGAELTFLSGSTYPDLVQGVAAHAPFDSVGPGSWTRWGMPLPSPLQSNGVTLVSGGTRPADALARTASWPRLLALLKRSAGDRPFASR